MNDIDTITADNPCTAPSGKHDAMRVSLHLTHACNFACDYCCSGRHIPVTMSPDVLRQAVDSAFARQSDTSTCFLFFGGEPLLRFDLIRSCVNYVATHQLSRKAVPEFAISTNGWLLTSDRCKYLTRHDFHVGISLDGNQQVHDSHRRTADGAPTWTRTVHAVNTALETIRHTAVLMTVNTDTVDKMAESIEFIYRLGVRTIRISYNLMTVWQPYHLKALSEQLTAVTAFYLSQMHTGDAVYIDCIDERIRTLLQCLAGEPAERCGMGCKECAVAPSGHIYACRGLVLEDNLDEHRIGHVQTGIDAVRVVALKRAIQAGDPRCAHCQWRDRCNTTCGCANKLLSGTWNLMTEASCAVQRIEMANADAALLRLMSDSPVTFLKAYGPWLAPVARFFNEQTANVSPIVYDVV